MKSRLEMTYLTVELPLVVFVLDLIIDLNLKHNVVRFIRVIQENEC